MEDVLWSTGGPSLVTEDWNLTGAGNMTVTEQEAWRVALNKALKVMMTMNTITLMLGMGSAIVWRDLRMHLRRPIGAVIGMTGQFLVLPATAFALCLIFQFRPYVSLGILLVSCCPGGTFSNFFTFWADGDLALSILMTTCSSLLALGGMPFNLWMYSHYWLTDDEDTIVIPFGNIIISLIFVTVPVAVGMVVRHYHEKTAVIFTKVASLVGWLGAITASVVVFILYWEAIRMVTPLIVLASLLLPFLGFIFAYFIARITCQTHRVARTIGIETGSQNMAVAATIIILSFSDPIVTTQVVLFPAMYAVTILLEAFLGIGLFLGYKWKFSKDDDDYPVAHTAKINPSSYEEGELENLK